MKNLELHRYYENENVPDEPSPATQKMVPEDDMEMDVTPVSDDKPIHDYIATIEYQSRALQVARTLLKKAKHHNENASLHYQIDQYFKIFPE